MAEIDDYSQNTMPLNYHDTTSFPPYIIQLITVSSTINESIMSKLNPYSTPTENLQRDLKACENLDEFIWHNMDIFSQNDFHGQLVLLQR